jgi:hypothetical protein
MSLLNIENIELLKKKAARQIRLEQDRDRNLAIYTKKFNEWLDDDSLKSVSALLGDEIVFENAFPIQSRISLKRRFGMKGFQFVEYPVIEEIDEETNEIKQTKGLGNPKRVRVERMLESIMKETYDIETIYKSWLEQFEEKARILIEEIQKSGEIFEEEDMSYLNNNNKSKYSEDDDEEELANKPAEVKSATDSETQKYNLEHSDDEIVEEDEF